MYAYLPTSSLPVKAQQAHVQAVLWAMPEMAEQKLLIACSTVPSPPNPGTTPIPLPSSAGVMLVAAGDLIVT